MNNNPVNKIERKILLVLAIVVVIGALFLSLVNFIANFLWFKEMGYLDVFFKQLVTQLTVGIPTFVVVTALVILYLNHLRKGYFKQIASGEETDMKALKKATIVLALLCGNTALVRDTEICQQHRIQHSGSSVPSGYRILSVQT